VSNFWLPAVEPTEELITELLQRSGAVHGKDSFKWQITFRHASQQITAEVGGRWKGNRLSRNPADRRSRRTWFVFAIVESSDQYVIWKLDPGTRNRLGDGWAIAHHVSKHAAVTVKEFPPTRGGVFAILRPARKAR
jgi:hypothetical protein